jgi:succinylglutamate desuccinylase
VAAGPEASHAAAARLGVPTLVGLEPLVAGTLIEWIGARGHAAVVLEGGQNEDAATVERHESAVWRTLCGAGVVRAEHVPGGLSRHAARLAEAASGLPAAIEVAYVHRLAPGEPFAMRPGYRSFQRVNAGEHLAFQGEGLAREVRAPWAGILLMPRYQGQGLDGFFLGRPAPPSARDALATVLG